MKKKILIIALICIVAIIGSISAYLKYIDYVNDKNLEKAINDVSKLLKENNFEEVYTIVNDNNLLNKANQTILQILDEKIVKYKVDTINHILQLSEEKWKEIEDFNKLLIDLKIDIENNKYTYLNELVKIKEDYEQYFNAIRWSNSNEYEQYNMYSELKNVDENSFRTSSNLLSKYSFEAYGLTSTYIKELNEETQKLSNAYSEMATALKTQDSELLEKGKTESINSLTVIADIKVKIILKSAEIETALKNLPTI